MKTNAIIRIILFSLALLILLGILVTALLSVQFFDAPNFGTNQYTEALEQIDTEYVTAEIRNIEIEWVAGSITFQPDPHATEINITEFSPVDSEYIMVCKQSGQTLKIQFSEDTFEFPSFGVSADISKDLVITIPADWECNSLEIETASAEVMMDGMSIQKFDFDGASGICNVTNCDIEEMDIDTASGNVYFSGTLGTLDCDAASADCSIEVTNIPRSIKLDGMSGDLELILPPDAGFTCNMDSLSGSFNSDFEFRTIGGTYIHRDGSCKIDVSAMSGDVSILKGIE